MVQISHIHRCTDFLFMLLNNSSFFSFRSKKLLVTYPEKAAMKDYCKMWNERNIVYFAIFFTYLKLK